VVAMGMKLISVMSFLRRKSFFHQKGKEANSGFQNEIDRCEINPKLISKIRENRKDLTRLIKDGDPSRDFSNLKIHIKPMACGLSVINKEGYFESRISKIDRNTVAVDMESFSIARSCDLSNDKQTNAIIIKSVMDKTSNKDDSSKKLAGYTSAQCAFHLIKNFLFLIYLILNFIFLFCIYSLSWR
jgi:nucleoside phosphorylase